MSSSISLDILSGKIDTSHPEAIRMRLKLKLTVASLKMLFRQKEAIIWSVIFPLFMMTLFGFARFGGIGRVDIGIVNDGGTQGDSLVGALLKVEALAVERGSMLHEMDQLQKGERDLVLVIPQGFEVNAGDSLTVYTNDAKPREAHLGALILQRVMDEFTFQRHSLRDRARIIAHPVKGRNLTYIDFLVPGILSMAIMQLGIFGVAFGFVSLKKRGILRRLWVTPLNPNDFILAQVATRLVLVMLQIVLMVVVGILAFDLHFVGSLWNMFAMGMLGAIVFLAIGFALAGISKSEDQVAPLANVISLPMMALSGIFFSRSALPGFVRAVTDYFPLTFLADGMRSIAIDGASLGEVTPQLMGLALWSVISCAIAVKMFRWE
jgi:ABC-2 type transport system permease protein